MTATACPRCGSTDPAVRLFVRWEFNAAMQQRMVDCDDPWHDRPTGADDPPSMYDWDLKTITVDDTLAMQARLRELAAENERLRDDAEGWRIQASNYDHMKRTVGRLREAGDALADVLDEHWCDGEGLDADARATLNRWEQAR